MPKITLISVQEKHKDRVNIFVDDEFFVGANIEVVYKLSIKKGLEVDKEFLDNLLKETQESDCFSKAIKYCSKGLKTEQQVKNNLYSKGFNGQIIYKTIEKLKSSKFIDDAEYSKRYMESTANKQGARLTNYKLYGKGIKKEVIDNTFLDSTIDYKTSAKMLAQKRLKDKIITKELLAKTYRYLIGRGFSYEEASYAISDYKVED